MHDSTSQGKAKLVGIKAVVFDVYGTLVEIRDKRSPYKKLLHEIGHTGRSITSTDKIRVMTENLDLVSAARLFGVSLPGYLMDALQEDLRAELRSICLYPDAFFTLNALRNLGYQVALCSNLAAPYAAPVKALLPFEMDAYGWSFEVGAVKPQAEIYEYICASLGCTADEIVMVGDTLEADYEGPRRFGMHALHIDRTGNKTAGHELAGLDEVLRFLS